MKNLLYLTLCVFLMNCEKEDQSQSPEFSVGIVSKNTIFKTYNPALEVKSTNPSNGQTGKTDSIDVDDDGRYDFKLKSYRCKLNTPIMEKYSKASSIYCLDTSYQIAGRSFERYTGVDSTSSNTKVYYDITHTNRYPQIEKWSTHIYPGTVAQYFEFSAKPNETTEWSVVSIGEWEITEACSIAVYDSTIVDGTPTYLAYQHYIVGDENYTHPKYVVFRKHINSKYYYGWIKLKIEDFSNIFVSESYFQKDVFNR